MPLVKPHGPDRVLRPRLVPEPDRSALLADARRMPAVPLTSREASDLLMLGMGAYTPLAGPMGSRDWQATVSHQRLADGTFWPIPITVSATRTVAETVRPGSQVALTWAGQPVAVLHLEEKYAIDAGYECQQVFGTTDAAHPGVAKVLAQGPVNLAGPVAVLSEGGYRRRYLGLYLTPAEARRQFTERGWSRVAALQTRNPLHRSHEFLAKIALEVCDGLFIHQVLGRLKPGDIPAEIRVQAVDRLVAHYFVPGTVVQAGCPLEMRYGGPREALLHAVIRQNFGVSHLVVGRDHAGVGRYYGPYDAQRAFQQLQPNDLEIRPLAIDLTFYCRRCDQMASRKTCPHPDTDRVIISGTRLRELLATGQSVPDHFSRPEVLDVLCQYYATVPSGGA